MVACSEPDEPSGDLPEVDPESVGFSSEALAEVSLQADTLGCAALMALSDGKVFYSWGSIDQDYMVHSIRKPLLSSLYGIAIEEGSVDLDASLADLGISDTPTAPTTAELQATVRDLLYSRSGVYIPAAAETPEARETRPVRFSHAPGTFFYYNNWDFNVLGSIYVQQTGEEIFNAYNRLVAEPIGMQDFMAEDCYYAYELEYSSHPAYVFRMSARDLARFGLLYAQEGRWEDTQIIPADWVATSTSTYSVSDTTLGLGYGMLWGTIVEGGQAWEMMGGTTGFFHTGYGGHVLFVIPDRGLVIVQRFNTDVPFVNNEDTIMILPIMILEATSWV